jgi:prevent-host-death family protein
MPQIKPFTDLYNNTTSIVNLAHNEHEPIFITENGHADLVVMSIETYDASLGRLEMYDKLAQSQFEVKSGQGLQTLENAFKKYRKKYVSVNGTTLAKFDS